MEVNIPIEKKDNTELDIQEKEAISRIAKKIIDRGFVTPAVFLFGVNETFIIIR